MFNLLTTEILLQNVIKKELVNQVIVPLFFGVKLRYIIMLISVSLISGLTGSMAFISSLASVSFIDVPDALSIIFACPLVTILLSAVMLRDKLNPVKICAGLLLFAGVILVCKPPFLFNTLQQLYIDPVETDETYAVGVVLAITACVTTGIMDVLVAKCEDVSTAVLVLWTALIGLVISVMYELLHSGSNILSLAIINIPALDWAIFVGKI